MRINQYLAKCGICSRRAADKLISSGQVLVDGEIATMGQDVTENNTVLYNGTPVRLPSETIVIAYYKPVGVTCTEKDTHAERTVVDEIKSERRITYAGRLDKESEGLLLMTDDGDLINAMMRSSNKHEKEYVVTVNKPFSDDVLYEMSQGVFLKELNQTTRQCEIKKIDDVTFNIVLTQGLNRQIRRMCSVFGMKVVKLKRTRVMNIELGNLQVGASRILLPEEKEALYLESGLHR